MRIISGTARGIKLETLPGTDITRPTTDRVKEAMFSSVQFILQCANVLDLFAGSGQMGIESLSRGAKHCVFCDESAAAINVINSNLQKTALGNNSTVIKAEAMRYVSTCAEKFDVIFLDPPYASTLLSNVLPLIDSILNNGGTVLAEAKTGTALLQQYGSLTLKKQYKYGGTTIFKYQK